MTKPPDQSWPAYAITLAACPSCHASIGQPCNYRGRRDPERTHIPRQDRAIRIDEAQDQKRSQRKETSITERQRNDHDDLEQSYQDYKASLRKRVAQAQRHLDQGDVQQSMAQSLIVIAANLHEIDSA